MVTRSAPDRPGGCGVWWFRRGRLKCRGILIRRRYRPGYDLPPTTLFRYQQPIGLMNTLLQSIRQRASKPSTQIDIGQFSLPAIAPPLTAQGLSSAERQLGFAIPTLLAQIYTGVGNGGFGPGYGLLGLQGGALDDLGHDAITLYCLYRQTDPTDPDWAWPVGLLPICHWGCAIYSCVDCAQADSPVRVFDPNAHNGAWTRCFIPHKNSLESWLSAWVSGVSLWDETHEAA